MTIKIESSDLIILQLSKYALYNKNIRIGLVIELLVFLSK